MEITKSEFEAFLKICRKYLNKIPSCWRLIAPEELCNGAMLLALHESSIIGLSLFEKCMGIAHSRMFKEQLNADPELRERYNAYHRDYRNKNKDSVNGNTKRYRAKSSIELSDSYIKHILKQKGYTSQHIERNPCIIETQRQATLSRRASRKNNHPNC